MDTCVIYDRICMDYSWDMFGMYMESVCNMSGVCIKYAWNVSGLCMEYEWDL